MHALTLTRFLKPFILLNGYSLLISHILLSTFILLYFTHHMLDGTSCFVEPFARPCNRD
jgi:hypothetical protein